LLKSDGEKDIVESGIKLKKKDQYFKKSILIFCFFKGMNFIIF